MNPVPFAAVVDEHGPVVLRVLTGLLGRHDAEDCWQETFVAALRAYPALPADANVRGWLLTIAHHKAIDHVRARERVPVAVGSPVPDRAGVDVAHDHELWAAVQSLPDKQRAAVTYRYLGGLSYRAIAELLGNSEAAARQNVREALRSLRQEVRP